MNMNLSESIYNRIALRSVVFAGIIHLILAIYTLGIGFILSAIIWLIAYNIARTEVLALAKNSASFKKNYPLQRFGASYGEFVHVFYHEVDLEAVICRRVEEEIRLKTPVRELMLVNIIDDDPNLKQPEGRLFRVASSAATNRGTDVSLVLRFSQFGKMQTIQWWALAGGYIDRNKRFNFIAYAPFTIWFWLIPYLNRNHDVVSKIRTVYASAYNGFDIQTRTRCLHEAVFASLIDELDHHGIDTSVLRAQRVQMMSINITGGSTNIGNVIQGAKNTVMSAPQGTQP